MKGRGVGQATSRYAYDAGSRIAKVGRGEGKTIYYNYDDADRLTAEKWYNSGMSSVYAFEWAYDAVGNRARQAYNGVNTYYTYDGANALTRTHELPADTASYYEYDARGNCVRIVEGDGTTYFDFNSRNLITQVTPSSGLPSYFRYDALQRRDAIVDSAGTAYFLYDRDGLCPLLERDASGTAKAEYTRGLSPVPGIGDLVAIKKHTDTTTYYRYDMYDNVGKVVRTVDDGGAIVGTYEYNAWGDPIAESDPPEGARFGFSAPSWMRVENIYISPTRIYMPEVGRFLQRDPIGYADGMNLYAPYFVPAATDSFGLALQLHDYVNNRPFVPPFWSFYANDLPFVLTQLGPCNADTKPKTKEAYDYEFVRCRESSGTNYGAWSGEGYWSGAAQAFISAAQLLAAGVKNIRLAIAGVLWDIVGGTRLDRYIWASTIKEWSEYRIVNTRIAQRTLIRKAYKNFHCWCPNKKKGWKWHHNQSEPPRRYGPWKKRGGAVLLGRYELKEWRHRTVRANAQWTIGGDMFDYTEDWTISDSWYTNVDYDSGTPDTWHLPPWFSLKPCSVYLNSSEGSR